MIELEENVFDQINSKVEDLTEEDVETWIVPQLMKFYEKKINFLAKRAYNYEHFDDLVKRSFVEQAKLELTKGVKTFLFTYSHWEDGRDLASYLSTCLDHLTSKVNHEHSATKYGVHPICPACKFYNKKTFLVTEPPLLKCPECSQDLEHHTLSESKIRLKKAFVSHTKKGFRCPECSKFLPASLNTSEGIVCPYEDCFFVGKIEYLQSMQHPLGTAIIINASLNREIYSGDERKRSLYDCLESNTISPESHLVINEQKQKEQILLTQVIQDQLNQVSKFKCIQKILMYQAYQKMTETHPEEMIAYLVHQKKVTDCKIQAKIFQTYVELIENFLPFVITKGRKNYDIVSLTDPELDLFLGKTQYEAIVSSNHVVGNNTKEHYIGGRQLKDYGPCYIGKLLDIVNLETGESLFPKVKEYNFSQIKLTEEVKEGTKVLVTHYYLASHYELGAMVYLQRTRRAIVDKVYLRLNKHKRKSEHLKEEVSHEF